MTYERMINVGRDTEGNFVSPLDEYRTRDSYSVAATVFNGALGVQAFQNTSEDDIYINRIYIHATTADANVITIYDGTVATATILWAGSIVASGTIDIEHAEIKTANDAAGIFIKASAAPALDIMIGAKRIKEIIE